MRKSMFTSLVVTLALLVVSGTAFAISYEKGEMGTTTGMQQLQQQSDLRTADQLTDFQVQSIQGENLGQVQNVIVDLDQGRIGYVVVGSSEAGQAQQKYIVPFNALQPSVQQNVLTLKVEKAQLMRAPEGNIERALTRQEGEQIHEFYGVAPYWEENEMEGIQHEQQQPLQHQERQ